MGHRLLVSGQPRERAGSGRGTRKTVARAERERERKGSMSLSRDPLVDGTFEFPTNGSEVLPDLANPHPG